MTARKPFLYALCEPSAHESVNNVFNNTHLYRFHKIFPGKHSEVQLHPETRTHNIPVHVASDRLSLAANKDRLVNWSWEARLTTLDSENQLATLDQARRAAIPGGALEKGLHAQ